MDKQTPPIDVTQVVAEAMREYHAAKLPDDYDGDKDKACWFDRHALVLLDIASRTTPAPSNTTDAIEKLQDRCDGLMTELDNLVKAIAARKQGHYDIPSLYEYTNLNFPTAWQHSGGNNEN